MNFSAKKIFISLLIFSFLFNFSSSLAKSNFKSPVLNSTDPVFNGPVTGIVRDEMTGIVYVGGGFTSVGENTGSGVPVNVLTGKTQDTFPKVNGRVFAVISDNSGGWYIGGDFTSVGGIIRNHLAHILSDGTLDLKWDPDANNTISTLAIKDSTIYIGGSFTKIGGTKRNHLAAIGTDGTLLDWNPDVHGSVNTLAIDSSTIYIGGHFAKVRGKKRYNLAAIGIDGTIKKWSPRVSGSGNNLGSLVHTLLIKDSIVYVGGNFNKIDGEKRNFLAAIGINGVIQDWNPNVDGSVNALAIKDSTIYVGGIFDKIGEIERDNLAAIRTDGTLLDWNPNVDGSVNALAIKDSTIYVGGSFTTIGESIRNRLAAIGTDGTLLGWNPNISREIDQLEAEEFLIGPSINALAINGSTIYVGGTFTSVGEEKRNSLAAIGVDGSLLEWDPNKELGYQFIENDHAVKSLAISGSIVYVGGWFYIPKANDLAAIDTNGTVLEWNTNIKGRPAFVNVLLASDSTLYVGGNGFASFSIP